MWLILLLGCGIVGADGVAPQHHGHPPADAPETTPCTVKSWFRDDDGDGHGVGGDEIDACDRPDGYADRDDDCDDTAPDVHPWAAEVCNGIDDDCDGAVDAADDDVEDAFLVDGDHDGYAWAGAPRTCDATEGARFADVDCDDEDASIHPGATDVVDDGVDQDCDGLDRVDPSAVVATLTDWKDVILPRPAGDVDGDGRDDVFASLSMADQDTDLGAWTEAGTKQVARLGGQRAFGAGDVDADGRSEIWILGETGGCSAWSPSTGAYVATLEDAPHVAAGDFDGDGFADVANLTQTTIDIYAGPALGDLGVTVPARTQVIDVGGGSGLSVTLLGDVDGDGTTDVWVQRDEAGVVLGDLPSGTVEADDVALGSYAMSHWDANGVAGNTDVDGDGLADVVLDEDGSVLVLPGPPSAHWSSLTTPLTMSSMPIVGDFDGDGDGDFAAIGEEGCLHASLDPLAEQDPSRWPIWTCPEVVGRFRTPSVLGDVDGDGTDDVGVSEDYDGDTYAAGGVVLLLSGAAL